MKPDFITLCEDGVKRRNNGITMPRKGTLLGVVGRIQTRTTRTYRSTCLRNDRWFVKLPIVRNLGSAFQTKEELGRRLAFNNNRMVIKSTDKIVAL